MSLEQGHQYLHGRLGRDWEQKTTKAGDIVYESVLAYQPTKDDETVWVDLTVWPVKSSGSTAPGEAIAQGSGKGTTVIVRGPVKSREYTSKKTGEQMTGWSMSVYNLGICPKVDWGGPSKSDTPASDKWAEAQKSGSWGKKDSDPALEPF